MKEEDKGPIIVIDADPAGVPLLLEIDKLWRPKFLITLLDPDELASKSSLNTESIILSTPSVTPGEETKTIGGVIDAGELPEFGIGLAYGYSSTAHLTELDCVLF